MLQAPFPLPPPGSSILLLQAAAAFDGKRLERRRRWTHAASQLTSIAPWALPCLTSSYLSLSSTRRRREEKTGLEKEAMAR